MVKHIVLFVIKEEEDKEAAVRLIASKLEPLVGVIPGLLKMEVRRACQEVDCVLYSEFESMQALQDYAQHSAHLQAKEYFWHMLDKRFCADYEV